jgi:hypothetical protein
MFRYQFGPPCCHLLVERLWIADEPLIDTNHFEIHWIPDRSFRDALPAQVLPELKHAEDVPNCRFQIS